MTDNIVITPEAATEAANHPEAVQTAAHPYPLTKPVCQLDADGYYLGETVADLSPMEAAQGVYLMPALCVDAPPPETQAGQAAWWDMAAQAWQYHPDYRGQTVYATASGEAYSMDRPGPYPAGTTPHPRPTRYHSYDESAGNWVLTEVAAQQQAADEAQALRDRAGIELTHAAGIIAALQDEIDLDETGDTAAATASLTAWRRYRVACLKVQRGELHELPARPEQSM